MERFTAKDFKSCKCLNVAGESVTIPAGRYPVNEHDVVTVKIGTEIVKLDKDTYQLLKDKRIVTEPLLF